MLPLKHVFNNPSIPPSSPFIPPALPPTTNTPAPTQPPPNPEIIPMGDNDPFKDTDLVVIQDNFPGALKPNEIKLTEFFSMKKFYKDIIEGNTPLQFMTADFKYDFECTIRQIFSRKLGREFLKVLCTENNGHTIEIHQEEIWSTQTKANSFAYYNDDKQCAVQIDLMSSIYFDTKTDDGKPMIAKLPPFMVLMHELVHCLHFIQNNSYMKNLRVTKISPQGDIRYHTIEEESTIEKDPRFSEHKFCEAFNVPKRFHHLGYPSNNNNLLTLGYFENPTPFILFLCKTGVVSIMEEAWVYFKLTLDHRYHIQSHVKQASLFDVAVLGGCLAMIEFIFNKGVKAEDYKKDPDRAIGVISLAICSNKIEVLQYVLKELDLKISDYNQSECSFVNQAVKYLKAMCIPMVEFLLQQGANLDAIEDNSPLDYAAGCMGIETYQYFYNKGLRPTTRTYFHAVMGLNYPLLIKLPLLTGWRLSEKLRFNDIAECTLMHIAAGAGDTEIIEFIHRNSEELRLIGSLKEKIHTVEDSNKTLPIEIAVGEMDFPSFKLLLSYYSDTDLKTDHSLQFRIYKAIFMTQKRDLFGSLLKMYKALQDRGIAVPIELHEKHFHFMSNKEGFKELLHKLYDATPIEDCKIGEMTLFDWGISCGNYVVKAYTAQRGMVEVITSAD